MAMIALVIIGDGRESYLADAMRSVAEHADHPFVAKFLIDDSGDSAYHAWLRIHYSDFTLIAHQTRCGMGAAVRSAYEAGIATGADYLFLMEEDFKLTEPVAFDQMTYVLSVHSGLAHMVLKRQAWTPEEIAVGGPYSAQPERYHQQEKDGNAWVEHDVVFSFNPALVPRRVCELGLGAGVEAQMTERMTSHGYRFAYWGCQDDAPRCLHIGHQRSPGWRV